MSRYIGYFDGIHDNHVTGWAYFNAAPEKAVEISILINDSSPNTVLADQYRQDLEIGRVGNGRCAFKFPIPNQFRAEKELAIEVLFKETGQPLENGGLIFINEPDQGFIKTGRLSKGCTGRVESFDGLMLKGSVNDPYDSAVPRIDLYIDGALVTHIKCEEKSEQDEVGHTFSYAIPLHFRDGQEHDIALRFAGTPEHLGGSPIRKNIPFALNNPTDILNGVASVVGKNGWLYLVRDGNRHIEQYTGEYRFTDAELKEYQDALEKRRDYLESLGIPYIFAVCPEKYSIYPEHLPDEIKRGANGTILDQLIGYLSLNSTFELLDLRPSLLAAKDISPYPLYYKNDTHWNDVGGFYAYRAIMQRIRNYLPELKLFELSDFLIDESVSYEGDLVERYHVDYIGKGACNIRQKDKRAKLEVESIPTLIPKFTKTHRSIPYPPLFKPKAHRPAFLFETDHSELPRAVFFMNSTAAAFQRWFPEHFSRIAYVWQSYINPEIIDTERPDIVLQMLPERYISRVPKQ